jgi:DNA mismatch repair protein MutL
MSSIIKILPDHIVNKIAAGEVVERPASVVKELIENSVDAGATEIFIDIEQAGRRLIHVMDNGSGMSKDDAQNAFLRHATSKITSDADLEAIRTMGFRGEALSSIASVSHVRMITSERGASSGVMVEIEGGKVKSSSDTAAPKGTSIEVNHLFYNTPARLKFLKSPATEFSHILSAVSRQAMAHPRIRFRLTHNKKTALDLPSSLNMKERTFQIYGNDIYENLMEFSGGRDNVRITGLIARPAYTRADRTYQDFYVNRRFVKNPSLTHALYSAYGDMLMRDRHPVGFLFIEIEPNLVDVNVHPAKAEVRFFNQSQMHDLLRDVIREGLSAFGTPALRAGAQGVKEAVSDYLKIQAAREFSPAVKPIVRSYGRRRSDFPASFPESEPASPAPQEVPSAIRVNQAPFEGEEDKRSGGRRQGNGTAAVAERVPQPGLLVPLAQVHDSFIVAQSPERMWIIDQHAAHERVLFERLQDQCGNGTVPVQDLLLPVQVEIGPAEGSLLLENLAELNRLGFIVEDFGSGTFVIKAVPALLVGADYHKLLRDIIDEITVHGESTKIDQLRDGVLSVMACHPAIKVHRHLEQREMENLLQDLFSCRMPHTCPHGRPTVVRFSMDEIKKMFKRM